MDKARRTYPLAIAFADGEQPSSAKLTGISTQAKNALGVMEVMVGDLWNQAGDPMLSPGGTPTVNALHIPNLARSVGRLSLLNQMVPGTTPLSFSMVYVDDVGTNYAGLTRGFLRYPPASTPTSGNMILSGTFAPLVQGSFTNDPLQVNGTGQWCVTSDGRLYTFDNIPSTLTLTYSPSIESDVGDISGSSPSWNVIPDPTTWSGNYAGVKISLANNTDTSLGFHIWLPPRKPLDPTKIIRSSPTQTNNVDSTPDSGSILFFQSDSVNASVTNAIHYRYNFPNEITSVGVSGDTIPGGFIYIWDETTGTIIDGATFFVPGAIGDRKFKIRATGTNLISVFGNTIGNGIITDNTTQLPADYISRFKIITVGASLSKTVSYLNKNYWNHVHKKSEWGNPVSHTDLDNLVSPAWDAINNAVYPSGISTFRQSAWKNDDHGQYLHRAGSTMSLTTARDKNDNCMLRLFGVKSPLTAYNQGRVNIAVTDNGQVGTLSATTFTTLNIGSGNGVVNGDSGGVVNLDKVQVLNKLFFADLGSEIQSAYTAHCISYTVGIGGGTYSFGDFPSANGAIVAGTITGSIVTGNSIVGSTSVTSGSTYAYSTPQIQYLNILPEEVIISAANQTAGLNYTTTSGGFIFNNDTGNTYQIIIPCHLPNGATVSASENIKIWAGGNGSAGLNFQLVADAKPSAPWVSLSSSGLASGTANVAAANNVSTFNYSGSFTIDNSHTGSFYKIILTFPVKAGGNTPSLWGITLQYRMPQVNN